MNKRRNLSIGWLMVTLFLMAVETVFFIPAISNSRYAFINSWIFLLPDNWLSSILWILIPIVYCSIVSPLLRPKRLVNPIHVQIGTISIVALMAINNLSITLGASPTNMSQSIINFSWSLTYSSAFAFLIGVFQWLSVRWLIRLNFENADRVSFMVNMPTKEILHKLGHSFLEFWNFSRECDVGDIWIMKRNDDKFRGLILEIGEHPEDASKSIVATVAYEVQHDWIIKSESAEKMRDIIIEDIEKRIGVQFSNKKVGVDDTISNLANIHVKDMTRSRLEVTWGFLRNISRFYQATIALTIVLLLGLSVLFVNFNQNGSISNDTYIGSTIALIVLLFVEIGFPLHEDFSRKKRQELEF